MKRKLFITCITLATLCLALVMTQKDAEASVFVPNRDPYGLPITVHIDGSFVPSDAQPIMENNRVFVPMRAAAEAMGAYVTWDGAARCVSVQKNGMSAYFFVGSNTYYVNNATKVSDAAPMLQNGRTLLPIRAFSEALGASVYWDNGTLDVDILSGGPVTAAPFIPGVLPSNLACAINKYYVPQTKPGVGSYYCITPSGYETIYELVFISETADGERFATEMYAKIFGGSSTAQFMNLYRHPVTNLGSSCTMYHNGIADAIYESDTFFGHTFTNTENVTFQYSQNNLVRTQRTYTNGYVDYTNDAFIAF